MRYLDPKNDLVFKKVFGHYPNITISFLNSVLPLERNQQIMSLQYLPTELVPELPLSSKNTIVDVRCRDNFGRHFIVEMQMHWTQSFKSRVLFNASKTYVRQLNKNEDYLLLQPVFALSIVNQVFEPDIEHWYHHYKLINLNSKNKAINGLQLIFVELPKFLPQSYSDKKLITLWLRYLAELQIGKHMYDKDLLKEMMEVPEIAQALELSKESGFTKEQLEAYDRYWDMVRLEKTLLNESKQEAKAEGRAEGRAEGKTEMILAFYDDGISVSQIAKASKMSENKVMDILKSNGRTI